MHTILKELSGLFIRAQNIRFGKLRLEDLAFVNPPSNSEGSRTQVAKGDLLIVITGAGVTNPFEWNVNWQALTTLITGVAAVAGAAA